MTEVTKYISLNDLKAYFTSNHVVGNTDDAFMTQAIFRAEAQWEMLTGSAFDLATETLVEPSNCWVDGNGWLWLYALERGPVKAVTAIEYRVAGQTGWTPLSWVTDDILLPPTKIPPDPRSWRVRVNVPKMASIPTGDLLIKWTYTGGYGTIATSDVPKSLVAIICRLAYWDYMLREAPINKIVTAELGLMQIPLAVLPDVKADANLWMRMES